MADGIFVHFTIYQCVGVNGENILLIIKIVLQLCFSMIAVSYSRHYESPQQDLYLINTNICHILVCYLLSSM